MAEECLVHGPLDTFSAFGFESYLGKMKGIVRSPNKPFAQISRRLSEHVVAYVVLSTTLSEIQHSWRDRASAIFPLILPDSGITKGLFACGGRKISYIISDILGPHFRHRHHPVYLSGVSSLC